MDTLGDIRPPAQPAMQPTTTIGNVLVIIARRQKLNVCFERAAAAEFSGTTVLQFDSPSEACELESPNTALVLVDVAQMVDFEKTAAALADAHGGAGIALMQFDERAPLPLDDVFRSSHIRGVLPMSAKLDVWLSVINLLKNGGEYYPVSVFRQLLVQRDGSKSRSTEASGAPAMAASLDALTERERQILSMVAHGQQNKLIAAALNLSESTVKIHLHNIIRKLKVHNRTEAAALYHRRLS